MEHDMCGRFSLTASPEEVADLFELEDLETFPPRYNIAPTQPILMANINAANNRVGTLVRWGLVPAWVKDPRDFTLLLNARSETAATKPSFRNAMRHRRTLIPASGFYEWHRPPKTSGGEKKLAYWITPRDGGIVVFGGLMETWSAPEGSEVDSGCILTTASNQQLGYIHHRMPVVIKAGDFERWLDCKTQEPRDIAELMQPVEDGYFKTLAISDKVNKVTNSGPEIQQEIAAVRVAPEPKPKSGDQLDLF
jgi:putative SOS response-associated peptidase YedK